MTLTDAPLRVIEKSDALAEAALPPPPAAAPPPAPPDEPVTVTLRVPIDAHGERLTSLTLRPPKVEDMEAVDMLAGGGKMSARTMSEFIMRLAGIPRSSVLQLNRFDWLNCARAADGFFSQQDQTS
jgi:Phage tail assembly chaperone proteins, E, or 41 or 14